MIRILIGFIFGVVVTFYSLPWLEGQLGTLPRPDISALIENHSSN